MCIRAFISPAMRDALSRCVAGGTSPMLPIPVVLEMALASIACTPVGVASPSVRCSRSLDAVHLEHRIGPFTQHCAPRERFNTVVNRLDLGVAASTDVVDVKPAITESAGHILQVTTNNMVGERTGL